MTEWLSCLNAQYPTTGNISFFVLYFSFKKKFNLIETMETHFLFYLINFNMIFDIALRYVLEILSCINKNYHIKIIT